MKRSIIAFSLAMVMILGTSTACGKKNTKDKRSDDREQSSEETTVADTSEESTTGQNGADTYDDPFQVSLDAIGSMKAFATGDKYTVYNAEFHENMVEAKWWDYESTMTSPGVYDENTTTLAFSIEIKPGTTASVYYAYYYSEDEDFGFEDMAAPIFSDDITPEEYNNGKAYYNVDCGKGIKKGYYAVVVAKDSTLTEPYVVAYAEVK